MTTCTACDRPARSRGLYQAHYHQARRAERAANRAAARTTEPRMSRTERLTEMQWLIDGGVWPIEAAKRVGYTFHSAETAAYHAGADRLRDVLRHERTYLRTA